MIRRRKLAGYWGYGYRGWTKFAALKHMVKHGIMPRSFTPSRFFERRR